VLILAFSNRSYSLSFDIRKRGRVIRAVAVKAENLVVPEWITCHINSPYSK